MSWLVHLSRPGLGITIIIRLIISKNTPQAYARHHDRWIECVRGRGGTLPTAVATLAPTQGAFHHIRKEAEEKRVKEHTLVTFRSKNPRQRFSIATQPRNTYL